MQKVVNHVINKVLIVLLIVTFNFSYSQNKIDKNDSIILKKTILKYYKINDNNYLIKDTVGFKRESLQKYYAFKYKKRHNLKIVDIIQNDSIIYEDKKTNDLYAKNYFKRYEVISKNFTKKDIENILKEESTTYWGNYNSMRKKENINSIINITRPYYDISKKNAMVYFFYSGYSNLVIYNFKNGEWNEIGNIINF